MTMEKYPRQGRKPHPRDGHAQAPAQPAEGQRPAPRRPRPGGPAQQPAPRPARPGGPAKQPAPRPAASRGPQATRRSVLTGAAVLGLGALDLVTIGVASLRGRTPQEQAKPAAAPEAQAASDEKPKTADLLMVGDVLAVATLLDQAQQEDGSYDFSPVFAHVKDVVQAADVAIVNQETILGGDAYPYLVKDENTGYSRLNSPQEVAAAEVAAGFDVAVKATNHALDQGEEGLATELAFWREKYPQIVISGAGDSQEAYDAVPLVTANGIKIAILSYTYGVNVGDLPNDHTVHVLDEKAIPADVKRAREAGADIVVAVAHWGIEYQHEPSNEETTYAQVFVDAGVDAIIGGHPHVIQPVELLEGKDGRKVPVFWSLGNFTSAHFYPQCALGGMAHLTFQKTSEGAQVTGYAFDPLVNHIAGGSAYSTYFLRDYTADLASENWVNRKYPYLSLEYLQDLAAQVLGEDYDAEKCRLEGKL